MPVFSDYLDEGSVVLSLLESEDAILGKDEASKDLSILLKLNRRQWWLLVAVNIFFLIAGQTAAVLLGRFYYDQGGSSTFIATIVQTAGFPILFIPLILLPSSPGASIAPNALPCRYIALIYIALGMAVAVDNLIYSLGLLYLSASTYSLICATQLAFNAVFAFFINSQKLTPLIINSVVVLSFSAALLGVNDASDAPTGVTNGQYAIGFLCTIGASALYSLLLSLMQLTFQKALKRETFSVVLEMQIYISIVATVVSIAGLFISGQWMKLEAEMANFRTGKASYVMTLVWTAVCWQVCSVGVVGLIFLVSSLFSNVISTVALAVGPIASVIAFHDKMNGVKIIAMLQALWGFASYIYQNYLDDSKLRLSRGQIGAGETQGDSSC
ncbi:Probable purine permease 11 [Dionaea muscipula]